MAPLAMLRKNRDRSANNHTRASQPDPSISVPQTDPKPTRSATQRTEAAISRISRTMTNSLTGAFGKLKNLFSTRKQKEKRQLRRKEKLEQRDQERRTEGLLRLALRNNNNSINSFTAADPGIYYRAEQGEGDPWRRDEGEHAHQ